MMARTTIGHDEYHFNAGDITATGDYDLSFSEPPSSAFATFISDGASVVGLTFALQVSADGQTWEAARDWNDGTIGGSTTNRTWIVCTPGYHYRLNVSALTSGTLNAWIVR